MGYALRKQTPVLTEQEYFAIEKETDLRHEFIDGFIYAMAGGSLDHNTIIGTLSREIGNHLKGKPCRVFAEGVKVKAPHKNGSSRYVYPDVVVDCSIEKAENNMLTTPVLIVEVLSASTHKYDETTKFQIYSNMPSVQEYVLVAQDFVRLEVQRRRNDWMIEKFFLGDEVTFESIGLTLPVEDIYERIENEEMLEWLAQKAADAALDLPIV